MLSSKSQSQTSPKQVFNNLPSLEDIRIRTSSALESTYAHSSSSKDHITIFEEYLNTSKLPPSQKPSTPSSKMPSPSPPPAWKRPATPSRPPPTICSPTRPPRRLARRRPRPHPALKHARPAAESQGRAAREPVSQH